MNKLSEMKIQSQEEKIAKITTKTTNFILKVKMLTRMKLRRSPYEYYSIHSTGQIVDDEFEEESLNKFHSINNIGQKC